MAVWAISDIESIRTSLLTSFDNNENRLKQHISKYGVVNQLYSEFLTILQIYLSFCSVFEQHYHPNLITSRERATFRDLMQQAISTRETLEPFNARIQNAFNSVQDFMNKATQHYTSLYNALEQVCSVNDIGELDNFVPPTPEWISSFQDPQVENLAAEWEDLNLQNQMSDIFQQLKEFVNEPESTLEAILEEEKSDLNERHDQAVDGA